MERAGVAGAWPGECPKGEKNGEQLRVRSTEDASGNWWRPGRFMASLPLSIRNRLAGVRLDHGEIFRSCFMRAPCKRHGMRIHGRSCAFIFHHDGEEKWSPRNFWRPPRSALLPWAPKKSRDIRRYPMIRKNRCRPRSRGRGFPRYFNRRATNGERGLCKRSQFFSKPDSPE